MVEWSNIDIAPTDGRQLMLSNGEYVITGFWSDPDKAWLAGYQCAEMRVTVRLVPTFWADMPGMPQTHVPVEEYAP